MMYRLITAYRRSGIYNQFTSDSIADIFVQLYNGNLTNTHLLVAHEAKARLAADSCIRVGYEFANNTYLKEFYIQRISSDAEPVPAEILLM